MFVTFLTWLLQLITDVGIGLVLREHLFFYLFQVHNWLVDDQNLKRVEGVKKREDKITSGSLFFFFIDQNLSHILFLLFLFFQILN